MKTFGIILLAAWCSVVIEAIVKYFGGSESLSGFMSGIIYMTIIYESKLIRP